jgi:hypothetical protein
MPKYHVKNKLSMPTVSAENQIRMQIKALNPKSPMRETPEFHNTELVQK